MRSTRGGIECKNYIWNLSSCPPRSPSLPPPPFSHRPTSPSSNPLKTKSCLIGFKTKAVRTKAEKTQTNSTETCVPSTVKYNIIQEKSQSQKAVVTLYLHALFCKLSLKARSTRWNRPEWGNERLRRRAFKSPTSYYIIVFIKVIHWL